MEAEGELTISELGTPVALPSRDTEAPAAKRRRAAPVVTILASKLSEASQELRVSDALAWRWARIRTSCLVNNFSFGTWLQLHATAQSAGAVGVSLRCRGNAHQPTRSFYTQALHARLQPLLLFYIDAASMVDQDDSSWELLLAIADTKDGPRVVRGIGVVFAMRGPLRHMLAAHGASQTRQYHSTGWIRDAVPLFLVARCQAAARQPGLRASSFSEEWHRGTASGSCRRARQDNRRN